MSKSFHCPKCKSKDIHCMITNETNVSSTGGGYGAGKGCLGYLLLGPLGLLCGACGSKQKITTENTQTTMWACKSCGHKFRDIAEIESQISKVNNSENPAALLVVGVLTSIFLGFVATKAGLPYGFFFYFLGVVFIPPYFTIKKRKAEKLAALYKEREYIARTAYRDE